MLARFDDGTPALMERQIRRRDGRLLWMSTLDLEWNDLPVKPVFLPFVHTVTKYLADYSEAPASLTVGQVIPAPRQVPGQGPRRRTRRHDRGGPVRRARVGREPKTARSS